MPRNVTVDRRTLDLDRIRGATVTLDGLEPVEEDTLIRDRAGNVLVAYMRLWEPGEPLLERLRAALGAAPVRRTRRAGSEVWQNSGYFGTQHRQLGTTVDFCRAGEIDVKAPDAAEVLYEVGALLEDRYWDLAPATYAHHAASTERILRAWRPPGLRCFTGGVVNRDNPITWHRDRGNFAHTWSAMPVVRAGMDGGALAVPELGVYLPTPDGTAVFFDGQSLIHGVSPLRRTRRDGHRFSVVFYAVQALWRCLPPGQELARNQARRTEREYRRATGGPSRVGGTVRKRLDALNREAD